VLRFFIDGREELTIYLVLIGIAAGLWAVAALLFALIQERPGATAGAATPLKELREGWKLIREQSGFRRYLLTRIMLMVGVELALPYYSLHGRQVAGPEIGGLGVFVVVSGIAAALSSTIWGSAADKSSRRTMIVAGGISLATALLALANAWVPAELASAWTYSPVFFLFGVAVAGVRMGRKTYIVDAVPAEQRATYVATGNTLVGAAGLASGLLGFALAAWGVRWLIVALAALSAAGSLGALLTPEAEQMRRRTEA
jgi:predicted MFS family arabinose efflux permease